MVSPITRKQAWDEHWNAERIMRYCEMVHQWHQRRHVIITIVLGVFLCGGVLSVVVKSPPWVQLTINALIPVTAICSLVLNDAKKAAIMHTFNMEILWIYNDYKILWLQIENHQIDNDNVLTKLEQLGHRTLSAQVAIGDPDILKSQRKNKKAEQQATVAMNGRYNLAV